MTKTLSQKFRFFTFISIALLAYVHGYNLQETYLAPFSAVRERLTFTGFFEYFIANGLLRFRIPLLFFISGYLYAMYDRRPYGQQVKRRFTTLVIPFLIWSALGLLFTFTLQQFAYTARVVREAGIDQLGDNRPYTEIGWTGMLQRWLLSPISYQLWFIVALFIYNVLYPGIRWLVTRVPYIWLPLCFLIFLGGFQFFWIEGRGLFFFSLGVLLQKRNISIEQKPAWFSPGFGFILFIGLCVIKTFMAFELDPDRTGNLIVIMLLYQVSVVAGIMAMWFGFDRVVHWCMRRKWFQQSTGYSFFLFGAHVPLLPYFMKMATMELAFLPFYRLICYLVVPALVLLFCLYLARLFRQYIPRVYAILTGGRGF